MGAKSLLRAFDLSPLVASNGPTTSSRASAISRERRHAYRPAPGSAPRAGSGAYLPQQREKPFPVLVVHEDRVALVPAGGEVPDGARPLRPGGPAHPAAISQYRDLTLVTHPLSGQLSPGMDLPKVRFDLLGVEVLEEILVPDGLKYILGIEAPEAFLGIETPEALLGIETPEAFLGIEALEAFLGIEALEALLGREDVAEPECLLLEVVGDGVWHGQTLQPVGFEQRIHDSAEVSPPETVRPRGVGNSIGSPAEELPEPVLGLRLGLREDDQAQGGLKPRDVVDPRPVPGLDSIVGRKDVRLPGGEGIEAERGLRQESPGGLHQELPVVDVVADQLLQRPGVHRLVEALVGEEVEVRETLETIGQDQRSRHRAGLANDGDVEELLPGRQVLLHLDLERGAREEVGEREAENPVPGDHRTDHTAGAEVARRVRSLVCDFRRARAETLADCLGIPGEITILSLKRIAASASTYRIRIYLRQQGEKPFPAPSSREIEWSSFPRELMCQMAPGTSGLRGRLTRQQYHSIET